ncbi:hypothetical protein [Candidatus Xianfuyuplasma coldseepsis]|uniref:Uncharacterized protein n=1 Tax=Candidatus Xianfuyuplasma coldseepsis TaxID=2782163 RepID=A0A7L7KU03_9MOLU|nr:hypothetical protein [Xianfuyuplasma coldseepsis]QMS85258.1 hypothetical protein G4Z02_05680 [Xianfuyuplasma coldseepsis]
MKLIKFSTVIVITLFGAYYSLNYIKDNVLLENETATKYSSGEAIDYQITFENMILNDEDYWIFEMKFDTHTLELEDLVFIEDIEVYFSDKLISNKHTILQKNGTGHHISYSLKIRKEDIDVQETDIASITIKFDFENEEAKEFLWNLNNYDWYLEE